MAKGVGMDWELRVSACKVLHIEQYICIYCIYKNNKVLLYSTVNYIQRPEINHNEKEYKKECICMYN